MDTVLILYAGLTGNTQDVATRLSGELGRLFPKNKFELQNIRDADFKKLPNQKLVFLGASSWSDPINPDAEEFIAKLSKEKLNLSPVTFALFGLGDSQFQNFCAILPLLKSALEHCHAKLYKNQFAIDGYPEQKHIDGLTTWATEVLKNTR